MGEYSYENGKKDIIFFDRNRKNNLNCKLNDLYCELLID